MRIKKWAGILTLGLMVILGGRTVDAAQSDTRLRVGISPFAPFVFLGGEEPSGASIDFWHQLSLKLDIEFEFVACTGVADKLKRLEEGRIDIAIGGITITEEREEIFDFTHPVEVVRG